jgi:hypothetical protein
VRAVGEPEGVPLDRYWERFAAAIAPGVLDAVIEESRVEAASILRARLTRALVEEAERLVASRCPRDGARAGPGPQTETATEAESEAGWYVYGVTWSAVPLRIANGVGGSALQQVIAGDLAAVVSPIEERSSWGIGSDGDVDLSALAPRAHEHAEVLEAMLRGGSVLPFRFGVMYTSLAEVEGFLREESDALMVTLRRLENRYEWGLVLEQKGSVAEEPSAALSGASDTDGPQAGRDYLTQRSRRQALAEDAGRRARHAAHCVHDELAAIASDSVVHSVSPSRRKGVSGKRRLFKASYLVDRDRSEGFRLAAEAALIRIDGDLAISGELTGPWPPYNFSELLKDPLE